ncbi:unnamed protein product, partial [Gulo gulo]
APIFENVELSRNHGLKGENKKKKISLSLRRDDSGGGPSPTGSSWGEGALRDQGPCVLTPGSPVWSQGPHARRQRKVASWRAHPGRETKPRRPAAAFSLHWARSFARLGPHRPRGRDPGVASRWHGGGLRRNLQ